MTLGRVLGVTLGNILTLATIEKRDRQSFESARVLSRRQAYIVSDGKIVLGFFEARNTTSCCCEASPELACPKAFSAAWVLHTTSHDHSVTDKNHLCNKCVVDEGEQKIKIVQRLKFVEIANFTTNQTAAGPGPLSGSRSPLSKPQMTSVTAKTIWVRRLQPCVRLVSKVVPS
ncbi:hypothetical protein BX600DRAFT_125287 [Xylariales sp. PMI_506]|nr:hypothetical protein BX600DRAFT_125287 [Xylariales sp. PMI_506]